MQPIDSLFWLSYNIIITIFQMGWTFLLDQDVPMVHAAKIVHSNPLLDNLKRKGKIQTEQPLKASDLDIYDEEEKNLKFNIADYYVFSKNHYQLNLIKRCMIWEVLAIASGIVCCLIPFYIYGYGVANWTGRTEDLFTVAFATY